MRRLALLLAAASMLATPALAQISVLSNPPGLTAAAVAGKANLSGGNSLTGDQTVTGNLTVTGTTVIGPQSGAATDSLLYFDNTNSRDFIYLRSWSAGSPTYDGGVASFRGVGLDITGNTAIRFFSGSALSGATQSAQVDASSLTLSSGITLKSNATTVLNGSGVLQAAAFPALTGDVTNSAGSLGTTIAANAVSYTKMQSVTASRLLGNPTGSGAVPSEISLAGGLTFSGTTLTAAGALTPTSVASSGAVSGTTVAATSSILSSGATAGVGYATGAGGAISQGTSRVTGVTLNKACGAITMFSAAGSATWATFVVTDSAVAATDVIVANVKSATNLYLLSVTGIAAGSFNLSFATTGGTATDAPVINYCVVKGVAA